MLVELASETNRHKPIFVQDQRGIFPKILYYKESFCDSNWKSTKHFIKKNRNLAFDTIPEKGVFAVPNKTAKVRFISSENAVIEKNLRDPSFLEKTKLKFYKNSSDPLYHINQELTRPVWRPLRKLITSLYSHLLFIRYGSLKNCVLITIPSPQRIGHGLTNADVAINEVQNGFFGRKPNKIFVLYQNVAEVLQRSAIKFKKPYYLSIFEKGYIQQKKCPVVFLFKNPLFVTSFARLVRKSGGRIYPMRTYGHRDIFHVLSRKKPSFLLPEEIRIECSEFCKKLGHDFNKNTILIANREPGGIITDDRKSEVRRYGFRNTSFKNLIPTIKYLCKKNNVYRIGKSFTKSSYTSERFFDLSSMDDSMFKTKLDFYLFSICQFFIGTTSGIFSIGQIMRKPIIWTNTVPMGHYSCWSDWDVSLFKICVDKKSGKYVPFKENLKLPEGWGQHAEYFSGNYKFKENSAKEILEATKEMERILKKKNPPKKTKIDKKFISFFPKNPELYIKHRGVVSEYFLNKYKKLMN